MDTCLLCLANVYVHLSFEKDREAANEGPTDPIAKPKIENFLNDRRGSRPGKITADGAAIQNRIQDIKNVPPRLAHGSTNLRRHNGSRRER
jgi:hypothetical protein